MISVIIPCYNSENFLVRAVNSVLNQTYTNWELIFINNNSTDQTQQLIDQYIKQYPNKMYALVETKAGACFARNTGLQLARGEWTQFLDADDEILPDKFERQLQLTADADVIIGSFTRIYYHKRKVKTKEFLVKPGDNIWYSLMHSKAGITSANLYRRSNLVKVDGWGTEMTSSQEYDLMFRLVKDKARVYFDKHLSALVHEEVNSVSRPKDPEKKRKIAETYVALRLRIIWYLNETQHLPVEFHEDFSVMMYNMLLGLKGASVWGVDRKMQELSLKVPTYYRVPLMLKHYIKRFILRSI